MTKADHEVLLTSERARLEKMIDAANLKHNTFIEALNAMLFPRPSRNSYSNTPETGREAILVEVAKLLAFQNKYEGATLAGNNEIERLNKLVRIALEDPTLKCEKEHVMRHGDMMAPSF